MIGVAVHPSEHLIVAEFFDLVVILARVLTPFDTTHNTQDKSRLGGFLVSDKGKRLPICGAVTTLTAIVKNNSRDGSQPKSVPF
jgi:hypothetical protein